MPGRSLIVCRGCGRGGEAGLPEVPHREGTGRALARSQAQGSLLALRGQLLLLRGWLQHQQLELEKTRQASILGEPKYGKIIKEGFEKENQGFRMGEHKVRDRIVTREIYY